MLTNQRGNIVYWVLSLILAAAVIFILALSARSNLDPKKNTDNCITNMQKIWVGVRDYVTNTNKDFSVSLDVLRNTKKPNSRTNYLDASYFCPESGKDKADYLVMGRILTYQGTWEDTLKVQHSYRESVVGVMVMCPNMEEFGNHDIPQSFYDNQISNRFQARINSDLAMIKEQAGNNPADKYDFMLAYFNFWKNTKETDFDKNLQSREYLQLKSNITGVPIENLMQTEPAPEA